jgi:hypothetical protein
MFRTPLSRRVAVALAAAASTATLGLAAAGAASAGVTPTPTPTSSYKPPPPSHVKAQSWQFEIQISDIAGLAVNDVEGTGAIPMSRWTDTSISANVDKFSLGGNSVTLWHDALPLPDVNLGTCTLTFSQPDGQFRIIAGTGIAKGLSSSDGQFDLQALVSFPEVTVKDGYGKMTCPLGKFSLYQLQQAFNSNQMYNLPQPTFEDFAVQGSALVSKVQKY